MSCKPKPLHFELYNDVHQTIARTRKKKKTDATPVLSRNRIFRRREFNFVNRFKKSFKGDERMKSQST